MELRVFETPGKDWDEFASRYTDLIFYQSIWSELLQKGLGGQPLYYYLKEGGEIVAGLPGVLLTFSFFKIFYASIPYGGLIGKKEFFAPLMELLEKEFERKGIDQARLTPSPFSDLFCPVLFYSIPVKCTLFDLREVDREGLLEGHKKYVRRDIRKAQRSGVSVRLGASREDARRFYGLYLDSMERNRAAAKYPLSWFETLCKVMAEKEIGTFLFAELNQVAIAGAVLVQSPTTTHYLHNGSVHDFLKYCPNELLIHSSLEMAIGRGDSWFDFMGSDPRDLTLLKFKEKWGGQSVDLLTYVRDYHPIRCKIWEIGRRWMGSRWGSGLIRLMRKQ